MCVINILTVFIALLALHNCNAFKIDIATVTQWVSKFKQEVEMYAEDVLAYTALKDMLRKYESDLIIGPINGSMEFEKLYINVNIKYSDLMLAVNNLKVSLESDLSGADEPVETDGRYTVDIGESDDPAAPMESGAAQVDDADKTENGYVLEWDKVNDASVDEPAESLKSGTVLVDEPHQTSGADTSNVDDAADTVAVNDIVPPPALPPPVVPGSGPPIRPPPGPGGPGQNTRKPLRRCCGPLPGVYNGRLRRQVSLEECYDKVDDELKVLATENFTRTLKSNYVMYPTITWQYFADAAGHFVQYPASNKLCDPAMPTVTSPLTAQWFVEKLRMERKNLIILLGLGKSADGPAGPGSPQTRAEVILDAVQQTLDTLTPNDKVNFVVFPSATANVSVPPNCKDNLMIASQRNIAYLKDFAKALKPSTGEPNLMEGLRQVYILLTNEKNNNPSTFVQRSNLVLIILDDHSSPFATSRTPLLELVATNQQLLSKSVQHFVYLLGKSTTAGDLTNRLAQIADQNNLKLNASSGIVAQPWPTIPSLASPNQTVGKEGVMEIVENPVEFPSTVAAYFRRLPPQIDSEINIITPLFDATEGATMTVAAPVYNQINGTVVAVAAVDSTLARVFADVTSIDVGERSYAFVIDVTHGHVLLHPKLRDPAESYMDDTVFPQLTVLEPDLNTTEVSLLLTAASNRTQQFTTKIRETTPLMEGELLEDIRVNRKLLPATIYFQRLVKTSLCLALVHYHEDAEEAKGQSSSKPSNSQEALHAPYHRIDKLMPSPVRNKPDPSNVCELQGNYVSFKESVIKLCPSVFADVESYKYSPETFTNINIVNRFIIQYQDVDTSLIKDEYKSLIQHTVRATNKLDAIWTSHAKDIVERFYGSPFGVFRLYPGVPLENTFDHMKTEWYKRSIAMPDKTVYHYGKLSWLNRENVVIVTKALVENGRLQGVTGMTMTPRFLTSQLINTTSECWNSGIQCHILDSSGHIIDAMISAKSETERHLSRVYPWLMASMLHNGKLKIDWCTGFSDGYHKTFFTLVDAPSSDVINSNQCLQYSVLNVPKTNLFVLVVANRTSSKCDDTSFKSCASCNNPAFNIQYHVTLPMCDQCLTNSTGQCHCQCYCDSDFDQCAGHYKLGTNFPTDACFNPPFHDSEKYFKPDSAGPSTKHCPLPCVAISDLDDCVSLKHCKLSAGIYPTCIWKDDRELNGSGVSYFFPTTTLRPPPTPPAVPKTPPRTPPGLTENVTIGPDVTSGMPTPPGLRTSPNTASVNPAQQTRGPGGSTTLRAPPGRTDTHTTAGPGMTSPKPAGLGTSSSTAHHKDGQPAEGGGGMSGGAIAALVIGLVALTGIIVYVTIKVKGKKFRRPGADESQDKYTSRNGLFDSSIFNKANDSVTIGTAPTTTIPYREM